jgi:hypothetical protein
MNPVDKVQNSATQRKVIGKPFEKNNPHRFKPGTSGNPGGKPKKKPLTEIYESIANDPKCQKMIRSSIVGLIKSKRMATILTLREIAERIEGKVPDEVQISGNLQSMTDEELIARLEGLKIASSSRK